MKPELINVLCCPECQGSLHPHDLQEKDGRWQSGSLECQCGQRYPIRDFIPRFVTDDAYVDNFSYEWTIHSKTQIDSRASSRSWTTFFEKTGITPESLRGKRVLDVGVGSGRFADVASKCGADVIGIDRVIGDWREQRTEDAEQRDRDERRRRGDGRPISREPQPYAAPGGDHGNHGKARLSQDAPSDR